MKLGVLIYEKRDYEKNQWFAHHLLEEGKKQGLILTLIFVEEIRLSIEQKEFFLYCAKIDFRIISFALNRSRNGYITRHLEAMGILVYNHSRVLELCNNKAITHQMINSLGISSIETFIEQKESIDFHLYTQFPYVVKSLDGHGGKEVFLCENKESLEEKVREFKGDYFLVQKLAINQGKDLRVYILGNKIYHSVLRYNGDNFKANFTLGGNCQLYILNEKEERVINKILEQGHYDFVGIDFLFDENNELLFNEMEDPVGCRMLYHQNIDIVPDLMQYIKDDI